MLRLRGAVHRHTGSFADRHQSWNDRFQLVAAPGDDLSVQIGGHAAHIVMHGRQDRDWQSRDIDARKDLCGLADSRLALVQGVCAQMLLVRLDMVLLRAAAAPSR